MVLANLFSDCFMPAPYSYELRQKAIASVEIGEKKKVLFVGFFTLAEIPFIYG